jgi:methionyl-tRNA formyltransferase
MSFKVVFMGTPDFAVHSLKTLHENSMPSNTV